MGKIVSEKVKQERLDRKREREKKYRERAKQDPVVYELQRKKEAERYKRRVSEGKLKPVDAKTRRDVKQQRKKWRENSKKYRERKTRENNLNNQLINNRPTPPDTPPGVNVAQLVDLQTLNPEVTTSRRQCGRKKVRKDRSRVYRKLKEANEKLSRALTRVEKYKKRCTRLLERPNNISSPSPRTKINKLARGQRISPKIRKELVFGESLKKGLQDSFKSCTGNKEKQLFHKYLGGTLILKRYKLLTAATSFFKAKIHHRFLATFSFKKHKRAITETLKKKVCNFLEQEDNTRLCPGKKDCITRNKQKKQMRMLSDNLRNLHKKFLASHSGVKLGYSSFVKLKPFWVVKPRVGERDTCLCTKHENFKLIIDKLHYLHVIEEKNIADVIQALTCNKDCELCLLRACNVCEKKTVTFDAGFDINEKTTYKKWVLIKETRQKGEKSFSVARNLKDNIDCSVGELIGLLEDGIPNFFHHILNIRHQFKAIHLLKANLTENEAMILVDFSENYCCKYAEEIQGVHFGASRQQVTMHTGVLYRFNEKPISFCTLSDSLRHDPAAIWAHLKPIITEYIQNQPNITTLHFMSDSPATQYRNEVMFNMLASYLPMIAVNITRASWNFSEAGHGKNAADGVGGVLKRTADNLVAQGKDVHNYSTFVETLISNVSGVKISTIPEEQIQLIDKKLPMNAKTITGTMKIHQITWDKSKPCQISLRTLSCFQCPFDDICCTYGSLGLWDVKLQSKAFQYGGSSSNEKDNMIGQEGLPVIETSENTISTANGEHEMNHKLNAAHVTDAIHCQDPIAIVGSWVAVIYGNIWYPGVVETKVDDKLTVKFMNGNAVQRNAFSWPTKCDRQDVLERNILCMLGKPYPTTSRYFAVEGYETANRLMAEDA